MRAAAVRAREQVAAGVVDLEHDVERVMAVDHDLQHAGLGDVDPEVVEVAIGVDLAVHRGAEPQHGGDVVAVVGLDLLGRRPARLAAIGQGGRGHDLHGQRVAGPLVRRLVATASGRAPDHREHRDHAAKIPPMTH